MKIDAQTQPKAKSALNQSKGAFGALLDQMNVLQTRTEFHDANLAGCALGLEGFDRDSQVLETALEDLQNTISKAASDAGFSFEDHQIEFAAKAAIVANDMKGFKAKGLVNPSAQGKVTNFGGNRPMGEYSFSEEDYDVGDIRQFQVASATMTLMSSLQTDVNKLFWPMITIDSEQSGLIVPATINMVMDDWTHSVNGALNKMGRKNTTRAFVDNSILNNQHNTLYPQYRESGKNASKQFFVDPNKVKPYDVDVGSGFSVTTAPLAFGEVNLKAICQSNRTLNAGVFNYTDTISQALYLKFVYAEFGNDVIAIPTRHLQGAAFVPSQAGDSLRTDLIFNTKDVTIRAETLNVAGAETQKLLWDYNISLGFNVNGNVTLDSGITDISGGSIKFIGATTKDGKDVDQTVLKTIKDVVEKGTLLGYELFAKHQNKNLRNIGLITETKTYNFLVQIPYLDPITSVTSTFDNNVGHDQALANLVTLQTIKCNNEGITAIFEKLDILKRYVAIKNEDGQIPELNAIGCKWTIPKYFEDEIRISDFVDGVRSAKRREDIHAGIDGYLHTVIMMLIEESEFLSAGRVLTGDMNFRPKVIVATDIVIHSYLTSVYGKEMKRDEYDIEFASDVNQELRGKIVISLANAKNTSVTKTLDPLSWGNLVKSTDMVSNLKRTLEGQTSNYLSNTPRYDYVWNSPVGALITVTDIAELAKKVYYQVKNITEVKDDTNGKDDEGKDDAGKDSNGG